MNTSMSGNNKRQSPQEASQKKKSQAFGKELILDVHNCNPEMFTREHLKHFFDVVCEAIDMNQEDLHFWDYEDEPEEYVKAPAHLQGVSAVQFISTSNITIHTIDPMKRLYMNLFSCKDFDCETVKKIVIEKFGGENYDGESRFSKVIGDSRKKR